MPMDDIRALLRVYLPGRRVRFKPDAQAVRDKVPSGIEEGVILKLLPVPPPLAPDETAPMEAYGLEIEIATPSGEDTVVVGTADIELGPPDKEAIRRELWHRTVHFSRSSGIGIAFPKGASDLGTIDDAYFRRDPDGRTGDLVVSLRVAVDPDQNPRGLNVCYVEADFTQCHLRQGKPSAKK